MADPVSYTDADVELVAKAVYDCDYVLVTGDPPWSGLSPFDQDSYRALARYVLDVLTDAGFRSATDTQEETS